MPPVPIRVLVLYSHPLLGEGLGRLISTEPGVEVTTIDLADVALVEEAIQSGPALIVVEEGGRLDGMDVLRRATCPVVVDVDITTADAWTLRREHLASRPDTVLDAIRAALHPSPAP